MSEEFDPYYRWLGIPPKEQPPNHYRLLGLDVFESDPALIDSFALRHTSFLREITDGPHLRDAQRLLNELAAARRCLLNPQRKAAYDEELRTRLAAAGTSSAAAVVPPPVQERAAVLPVGPSPQPPPGDVPSIAVVGDARDPAGPEVVSGPERDDTEAGLTENDFRPLAANQKSRRKPGVPGDSKRRWPVRWLVAGSMGIAVVVAVVIAVVSRARTEPPRPAPATSSPSSSPSLSRTSSPHVRSQSAPGIPELPVPVAAEPATDLSPLSTTSVKDEARAELPSASTSFVPDGQPPRLPGLVLWLDASQLAPADARIARWSDGSGSGYTAQQKQETRQPECLPQALNGKSVVRFDGGPWLEIPGTSQALNLGSEYTITHVARGLAGTLLSKGSGSKTGQFSLLSDSCFLTSGEFNATAPAG